MRLIASSRSLSVRRLVFSGKSRRRNEATMENPAVAEPSTCLDIFVRIWSGYTVMCFDIDDTHDEQPLPTREPVGPVKPILDSSRNEASEGSGQDGRRDVYSESLRLLVGLVPARQCEQHTRGESGLKDTNYNSQSDKSLVVRYPGHGDGYTAPQEHYRRQEDRRLCTGEDHVGGNFEDDVANEEDCEGNAVFRRVHVQVICHAGCFGVADAVSEVSGQCLLSFGCCWDIFDGKTHFVRSMYDNRYIPHIAGSKYRSIFRTSFFSSGVSGT